MKKILNLIFFPYLISLLIYIGGPVDFGTPSLEFFLVIVVAALLFIISYKYGYANASKKVILWGGYDNVLIKLIKFNGIFVFVGSIAYLGWLLSSGASVSLVVDDAGSVRSIVQGSGLDKMIYAFFAYQAYLFIPIVISPYIKKFSRLCIFYYGFAICVMALCVILQAGRTFFLVLPVIIYSSYILLSEEFKIRLLKSAWFYILLFCVLIFGTIYVYFIAENRPGEAEITNATSVSMLRYGDFILDKYKTENYYKFLVTFHYFSGSWFNFDKLIQSDDQLFRISSGPFAQISDRILMNSSDGFVALSAQQLRYISLGGQQTGWRTGYGNVLFWYGYIGLMLFVIFLGYLIGRVVRHYSNDMCLFNYLRSVWLIYLFIFSIFYFPLDSIFFINAAILFFIVPVIKRFLYRRLY